MNVLSQICILITMVVACVESHQIDKRATGRNCPRNFDFPKGINCKKCTRYVRKGSKVRFRCPKGYSRYGNKNLICRQDNTWNGDPPACVKPGCTPIDRSNNLNLVISEHPKFADAVITFQCEMDYILFGAQEIHCDGNQWSHPIPTCKSISDLLTCDFETDLCGWTMNHTVYGNRNWTRHIGSTQTGGTGPKRDHTHPNSDTGHYMYFESSSPAQEDDKAVLVSPLYTDDLSPMCFEFWYHMLGPEEEGHVGSLELFVKGDSDDLKQLQPAFIKEGNQGDLWHRGEIYIDSMFEDYQIIIVVTKKKSYMSDIAIDDVRLYNCTSTTTASTTPSTTPLTVVPTTGNPVSSTTVTTSGQVVTTTGLLSNSTRVSTQAPPSSTKITGQPTSVTSISLASNGSTKAASTPPVSTTTATTVTSKVSTKSVTGGPGQTTTKQLTNATTKAPASSTQRVTTTVKPSMKTTLIQTTLSIKSSTTNKTTIVSTKIPSTNSSPTTTTTTTVSTKMTRTSTTSKPSTTTAATNPPTTTKMTTPPTVKQSTKLPTPSSTVIITSTTSMPSTQSPSTVVSSNRPASTSTTQTSLSTSSATSPIASSTRLASRKTSQSPNSTISSTTLIKSSTLKQSYTTTASSKSNPTNPSKGTSTTSVNKGNNSSVAVTPGRSTHPEDETLKPLMIGLGVGIIAGLIIIGVIGWFCRRRRKFYTSRYEDELKPITNAASTQSLNNVEYYQDDFDIENVR